MPKATTDVTLIKTAWTKIADANQTYMLTMISGFAWLRLAASDPGVEVNSGHALQEGDTFGDSATNSDNAVWMRAREVGPAQPTPDTKIALTK